PSACAQVTSECLHLPHQEKAIRAAIAEIRGLTEDQLTTTGSEDKLATEGNTTGLPGRASRLTGEWWHGKETQRGVGVLAVWLKLSLVPETKDRLTGIYKAEEEQEVGSTNVFD